jgi:hypothetical protein
VLIGGEMYIIKDCSDEAKKLIKKYYTNKEKALRPDLKTGKETPFPFKAMFVGQSFYMIGTETDYYTDYLVKKRIRDYNKRYNTEFAIVKHEYGIEIVRIG